MSVMSKMHRQNYVANFGQLKPTYDTRVIHFDYYALEQL